MRLTHLLGLHLELLLLAVHVHHGPVQVLDLDVILVHSDLQLLDDLRKIRRIEQRKFCEPMRR
jgi:hypothetical protein